MREDKELLKHVFGVDEVFFVDEPMWFTKRASAIRLFWRRELATLATVFLVGMLLGCIVGVHAH